MFWFLLMLTIIFRQNFRLDLSLRHQSNPQVFVPWKAFLNHNNIARVFSNRLLGFPERLVGIEFIDFQNHASLKLPAFYGSSNSQLTTFVFKTCCLILFFFSLPREKLGFPENRKSVSFEPEGQKLSLRKFGQGSTVKKLKYSRKCLVLKI